MRRWPEGWLEPGFDTRQWKSARASATKPGTPNLSEVPRGGPEEHWTLQPRTIPKVREERIRAHAVDDAGWIEWRTSPEEYFECFPDDAFAEFRERSAVSGTGFPYLVPATGDGRSAAVTFALDRELTGHPYVTVRAPAGTVVEILFVEKQEPGRLLLRTHPRFGQWIRLVTREGDNRFEAFEYDTLRQMQLLIRGASAPVEILDAGVIAKSYDWPFACDLKVSDAAIERACAASLNTHDLTSIETIVDNQVRERQQYAGDLEHPKLASYYAHGEYRQPARIFRTYAQGQSKEGWFLDCYPAWDRCQRLYQKHLGLTEWGPILDHSLQFGISFADYYLFTGDSGLLREITPRLARFDGFLQRNLQADGLLTVEPWTWNSVWIDHIGFRVERDKHAALNLYYAGFLRLGLARLFDWLGDTTAARDARRRAALLISRVKQRYWSPRRRLYVDNLPNVGTDGETRLHARTLSMALLFDAADPADWPVALDLLESLTDRTNPNTKSLEGGAVKLGANYPLNDVWRHWALALGGRGAAVARDLRERWADLPSVVENNTYAEFWNPAPSSTGQVWCQNNPVPLIGAYQVLLGVKPVAPGFRTAEIRPQPGDSVTASATIHTVIGDLPIRVEGRARGFRLAWTTPAGMAVRLVVPAGARVRSKAGDMALNPGGQPGTALAEITAESRAREWTADAEW